MSESELACECPDSHDEDSPCEHPTPSPELNCGSDATAELTARNPLERGLERLRNDVESALQDIGEADKPQSMLAMLWAHPALATIAFLCIAALILSTDFVQRSLASLVGNADEIIDVKLARLELIEIQQNLISVRAIGALSIDYSPWQNTLMGGVVAGLCAYLGQIEVSLAKPAVLEVLIDDDWKMLASVDLPEQLSVDISDENEQQLDSTVAIIDVGLKHTISSVVELVSNASTLDLRARATITLSKWGLYIEQDVVHSLTAEASAYDLGLALQRIAMIPSDDGLAVIGVAELSYQGIELSATVPSVDVDFSIPGCTKPVWLGSGKTHEVSLKPKSNVVNVSVEAQINELSTAAKQACLLGRKSPIDSWVSGYLEGQSQAVLVEASIPETFSTVLAKLLNGIQIPYNFSTSPGDKLLKSAKLRNVNFENPPFEPRWTISGSVEVVASPPEVMFIRDDVVAGVSSIRGDIFLFHNGVNFGSMTLDDWEQCETARSLDLFLVTVELEQIPFEVNDTREFMIVSRLLLAENEVEIEYHTLLDVQIFSPIDDFVVTQVSIQGKTTLSR